ncbi:substrate-binding periplasmic protein [Thalassotalea fusca]
MLKACIKIILTCLLLFVSLAKAEQTLRIGVGNFPPFFIEAEETGIFIEITDAIFSHFPKYKVEYVFMSNHRLLYEINSGKIIDVACNIFPGSKAKAHLSEPVFRYRDVAVTRKSANLIINDVSDLQGKSIAAYQGAKELLGETFRAVTHKSTEYSEHAHPSETTNLLISGSKDVRVGDVNIFWHDLKNKHHISGDKAEASNYTVHYIWPDIYSHMAFVDESLRDEVNKVIIKLREDGTFNQIYEKYKLQ